MKSSNRLRGNTRRVPLGKLVTSRAGKTPSRGNPAYWGGTIPWLSAKDLKTSRVSTSIELITSTAVDDGAPLSKPGDILVLVRGMTLLKDVPIALTEARVSFNQDLRCLHPGEQVSGEYLAHLLSASRGHLLSLVTHSGHGTGRLESSQLLEWILPVPPREIQEWLVARLRPIDECILLLSELLAAKRTFKRALMQDLLTGRRRFGSSEELTKLHPSPLGPLPEDWELVPLSSVARRVTRRNAIGELRVLTCSGELGLVDQAEFFSKIVASDSRESYFLLKRGEFAYNRSTMKGYPFGAIKRLDQYESGALSTLNICFALRQPGLDPDFTLYLFESGLLNRQLGRIARVGSRAHGLLNVTASDFMSIVVPQPTLEEQQRIARLLAGLDKELAALLELQESLARLKRGLMQKLLSGEIAVPDRIGTPD